MSVSKVTDTASMKTPESGDYIRWHNQQAEAGIGFAANPRSLSWITHSGRVTRH
jgi:hypothetical protein